MKQSKYSVRLGSQDVFSLDAKISLKLFMHLTRRCNTSNYPKSKGVSNEQLTVLQFDNRQIAIAS
jgi:hypothetical protein